MIACVTMFHASFFAFLQLWTLYCEHQFHNEGCEMLDSSLTLIMEFWARVTPGILHLLQHTKEVCLFSNRRI